MQCNKHGTIKIVRMLVMDHSQVPLCLVHFTLKVLNFAFFAIFDDFGKFFTC